MMGSYDYGKEEVTLATFAELVDMVIEGSANALELLRRQITSKVHYSLYKEGLQGNYLEQMTEEVVATLVSEKISEMPRSYSEAMVWLRWRALDILRKQTRDSRRAADIEAEAIEEIVATQSSEEFVEQFDVSVRTLLAGASATQRRILLAAREIFNQGGGQSGGRFPIKDVARQLQMSEEVVKGHVQRIRERVRVTA